MASLPTGSNKILEVHTESVSVVIKSKKSQVFIDPDAIMSQDSTVDITAINLRRVKIYPCDIDADYESSSQSCVQLAVAPLFFEQTDYEIVIQSKDGKAVTFWHENPRIREKIDLVTDENLGLISGIVNFGNNVGYSDFEIMHDGHKHLIFRIEVFPSKISYKEDYKLMLEDISNEIYSAVIDFLQKTYEWIRVGNSGETTPALFFQIISTIFERYMKAAKTIIASPHHKLALEHQVMPAYKARRTDARSEKWLVNHPEYVQKRADGIAASKVLAVRKQITYDTVENQFAKFILNSTVKQLQDFKRRYLESAEKVDTIVVDKATLMISAIKRAISTSFLEDVSEYKATQSMSLVFEMAPGYRELYKYHLMLKRGLSINGDVFKVSMKDTAQLYEYWCFIKLVSIMKKQDYRLFTDDVIKVDKSGVTVTLVKGRASEVKFINPRTGEKITLTYNPAERNTPTVSQKPDNVLTLEKVGAEREYKYVFDAKYRIEARPDSYYPDSNVGPKLDDINTMHRYRDAIVYDSGSASRFMFKKEMFGAYVLFPYGDEKKYEDHHFYKSIDTVNIGGLPFLPGATRLVEKMLGELVADSEESAFERASLPAGIEKRLSQVDWSRQDVLVGSFRKMEQFNINYKEGYYYVPLTKEVTDRLPIRYVALYQSTKLFGVNAGIRYYGEVLTTTKVRRKQIPVPMTRNNGEDWYYVFRVREWKSLNTPIAVKEEGVSEPKYTNMFLLTHCTHSYELFNIHSEEQFRLLHELKRMFDHTEMNAKGNDPVYRIDDKHSILVHEGRFDILNENGERLFDPPLRISDFSHHPRYYFNMIAERLK